jgi:hypothetical protein
MKGKKTFVVGKADRRAMTVVVVRCEAVATPPARIHGPWTLKAIVSAN